MELGIHSHLASLSLSDTVSILDRLGVQCHRSTVHRWVNKADLQPADGANPNHVAVGETVIQLDNQRFWLYAAVEPASNRILHVKLTPTGNSAISPMFLAELREKHRVGDAFFLVDSAPWLHTATASDSSMNAMGIGILSNVSFERQNTERTGSVIRSATSTQPPLSRGSKPSPPAIIRLSKHYPTGE